MVPGTAAANGPVSIIGRSLSAPGPLDKLSRLTIMRPGERAGMERVNMALLRGVCQTPASTPAQCGFFRNRSLEVQIEVASTAWLVPEQMAIGAVDFAVIPWTRVTAA